eukprot:m.18392 g.18392  ORF g.18392 m.18392 type:complete len:165 (+) comp27652_c0_seq1:163-657(+)
MQSDFIVSAVSVAAGIVAVMLLILMTIGSVYEDTKKEAFRDADASQCQARKPVPSDACFLSDKEEVNFYVEGSDDDRLDYAESLSETLESVSKLFTEADLVQYLEQQNLKEELLAQKDNLERELERLQYERDSFEVQPDEMDVTVKEKHKKQKKLKQKRGAKLQ